MLICTTTATTPIYTLSLHDALPIFFLEEVGQDYVRTARAKGMSEARTMGLHVLRNAAIPILTNVMIQLPGLLAGAFLIERDRKSTRLNSSHRCTSYAVFCLKKKKPT